jgi:hypothetical protein
MLTLPAPPRRAHLAAFAGALGLVGGVALGALLGVAASPAWAALGPGLGTVLAAVGVLRPRAVAPLYAAWSGLEARYRRVARLAVKAAAFLPLVAMGPGGDARLGLAAPEPARSLWLPRTPDADAPGVGAARGGLVRSYAGWAARGGRWWTLALLPFLVLLAAIDADTEPTLPTQTYTLF